MQSLLALRNAVENWGEFAGANNFQGWSENVPACTWTGITCSDGGEIITLSWQCESCQVKARGMLPRRGITTLTTLNLQANRCGLVQLPCRFNRSRRPAQVGPKALCSNP